MGRNWMSAERRQDVIETAERTVAEQLRAARACARCSTACRRASRTRSAARRPAVELARDASRAAEAGGVSAPRPRASTSNAPVPERRRAPRLARRRAAVARPDAPAGVIGAVAEAGAAARARPPTSTSATPTTSARRCPASGCSRASTSAPRCAGSSTSRRRGRCCSWATTPAATSRPDTHVFTLAFSTYFGVERRFHQLAHNLVLSMPGLGDPAQVRHRGRHARERRAGARRGRRAARLPGRRLRGAPARPGSRRGWTSAAARASSGSRKRARRAARPGGGDRRPGDRALPLARRAARAAARARPHVPPEGAADLARAAVGPERGRHARPHPAAGEDHDPGARADRRVARMDVGRGVRAGARPRCRRPSPRSPRSAACRCSADAGRARHPDRRAARGDLGARRGPGQLPALLARPHAARAQERGARAAARASRSACAWARPTSAAWSRSWSSTSRATWPGPASPASTTARAGGCARPTTGARRSRCGSPGTRPAACSASIADRLGAPMVARILEQTLQNLALRAGGRGGSRTR